DSAGVSPDPPVDDLLRAVVEPNELGEPVTVEIDGGEPFGGNPGGDLDRSVVDEALGLDRVRIRLDRMEVTLRKPIQPDVRVTQVRLLERGADRDRYLRAPIHVDIERTRLVQPVAHPHALGGKRCRVLDAETRRSVLGQPVEPTHVLPVRIVAWRP